MSSVGVASLLLASGVAAGAAHVRDVVSGRRARNVMLEQVGLRERTTETAGRVSRVDVRLVLGSIAAAVAGIAVMGPIGLLAGGVPVATVRGLRSRRSRRRHEMIDDQLASALQLIIGHLRIGRNIVAAIAEAADAVPEPLGGILGEIVAEARLGAGVEDALAAVAAREENRHLGIVASAVGLHVRHGGQLVEILQMVLETIEEEDRLRRDIRSITADGRLSAQVLLAMPPAMLVLVSVLSPGYASPLFEHPVGRSMSMAAVVMGLVGWRWLRSLSTPKVVA
jgi:tight adherence protein B